MEQQQFMQDAQRKQITLEMQKLESEIVLSNSVAELNMAKKEVELSQLEMEGDQQGADDVKLEIMKLKHQQQLQKAEHAEKRLQLQMTLQNKVEIAGMQVGVKREGMLHDSAINRGKTALTLEQERTKQKQAAAKPASTSTT